MQVFPFSLVDKWKKKELFCDIAILFPLLSSPPLSPFSFSKLSSEDRFFPSLSLPMDFLLVLLPPLPFFPWQSTEPISFSVNQKRGGGGGGRERERQERKGTKKMLIWTGRYVSPSDKKKRSGIFLATWPTRTFFSPFIDIHLPQKKVTGGRRRANKKVEETKNQSGESPSFLLQYSFFFFSLTVVPKKNGFRIPLLVIILCQQLDGRKTFFQKSDALFRIDSNSFPLDISVYFLHHSQIRKFICTDSPRQQKAFSILHKKKSKIFCITSSFPETITTLRLSSSSLLFRLPVSPPPPPVK